METALHNDLGRVINNVQASTLILVLLITTEC
jgi:hypothetical protein